jgi:hypothetical protein
VRAEIGHYFFENEPRVMGRARFDTLLVEKGRNLILLVGCGPCSSNQKICFHHADAFHFDDSASFEVKPGAQGGPGGAGNLNSAG